MKHHQRLLILFLAVAIWLGCALPIPAPTTAPPFVSPPSLHSETRPDGAIRLFTPPSGASAQNPAFSPDGASIVFTLFDNGYNIGPAGVFLLDPANGQTTRLTPLEDQDNVNLPGSVRRFQKLMERLGVDKALHEAGAQEGDTVYIGEYELEYQD